MNDLMSFFTVNYLHLMIYDENTVGFFNSIKDSEK